MGVMAETFAKWQKWMPRWQSVFMAATGLFVLMGLPLFDVIYAADDIASQAALALEQADKNWILLSAAAVFLMQAGFLCLEVGSVRAKSANITALKNVGDWVACAAIFFFVGWPLMFGHSGTGFFGADLWSLAGNTEGGSSLGIGIHFLFQLAFAGTAATIVSGAMAERTGFLAYFICSLAVTGIIYPIAGHWAWGNSFFGSNEPFLAKMGFLDFAGSTVVHSVGGWVALIGLSVVGPRLGRFNLKGEANPMQVGGTNWSAFGVLILWFGWWGFNGGSTLALNGDVGGIIINTNLAASFGAVAALLWAHFFHQKRDISAKFLNGVLAGLVGITAGCAFVTPFFACVIGFTSGILSTVFAEWMLKKRLDDPVGAVPVHLACGMWGTLCVGLFGKSEYFGDLSRLQQIGVQAFGILVVGLWSASLSFLLFKGLKRWVGLRVSPTEEVEGYDIGGVVAKVNSAISEDDARKWLEAQ